MIDDAFAFSTAWGALGASTVERAPWYAKPATSVRRARVLRVVGPATTGSEDSLADARAIEPAEASASIDQVQAQLRSQQLVGRLVELAQAFYEDHGKSLNAASWGGVLKFVREMETSHLPNLSADSEGLVIAEWRAAEDSIAMRFLNRNQFHYALAIRDGTKTHRPWGTSDAQGLLSKHQKAGRIIRSEPPPA